MTICTDKLFVIMAEEKKIDKRYQQHLLSHEEYIAELKKLYKPFTEQEQE